MILSDGLSCGRFLSLLFFFFGRFLEIAKSVGALVSMVTDVPLFSSHCSDAIGAVFFFQIESSCAHVAAVGAVGVCDKPLPLNPAVHAEHSH